MALIESIEVENYRCFRELRVEGLNRVNLLVGRNNSGKTALLEAIEAVVSEESPYILYRASMERGEFRAGTRGLESGSVAIDVRHWFRGHGLERGSAFTIQARGEKSFFVSRSIQSFPDDAAPSQFVPDALMLTLQRKGGRVHLRPLPLLPDGYIGAGPPSTFADLGNRLNPPVGFVTTRRLGAVDLMPMWSKILLTPSEAEVERALRILDPSVDRVALLGLDESAQASVLFAGALEPVPLGSLGEGATRMLTLAVSLAGAKGGFLLIDEIETGLHYSVHREMWRLVIETARRLDVQVFATTHSKDCLEAIARLHEEAPELAAEVTVHRLEAGAPTSVRMTAAIVAGNVDGQVDVR